MQKEFIRIKNAREHNLKSISLNIPRNKMIVFSGVSGSGKSSLAFDTIFAEGQRRYIESLSPYARQFLGELKKPDVEEIEGLSPAIAIPQKVLSTNPRSTVATLTEIYDYLRVLFARIGKLYCPHCQREIKKLSLEEMVKIAEEKYRSLQSEEVIILSPVVWGRKGEYSHLFSEYLRKGFDEARVDKKFCSLHNKIELSRYRTHTIEIVTDRLKRMDRNRLFEAVEVALHMSRGLVNILFSSGRKSASPSYSRARSGDSRARATSCSPPS